MNRLIQVLNKTFSTPNVRVNMNAENFTYLENNELVVYRNGQYHLYIYLSKILTLSTMHDMLAAVYCQPNNFLHWQFVIFNRRN